MLNTNTVKLCALLSLGITGYSFAFSNGEKALSIAEQRHNLEVNTVGKGFGPQSPRDIDSKVGENPIYFSHAPEAEKMNLCNIHLHKGAEHKGGEFTTYIGDGDGHGYGSGFKYSGTLTPAELKPIKAKVCPSKHGGLYSGDTIEVHYVYSTNQIEPGETLGACLNDSTMNPQLRVESQVYVLVNDKNAADFTTLTHHELKNGKYQAVNLPTNTGTPVLYSGSTTGPKYNQIGSPFKVTWNVRPKVAKVNIETIGKWCEGNDFNESYAHSVRNLVENPKLLSPIK